MNIDQDIFNKYQREFLRKFPDCRRFQTESYLEHERAYKIELNELFDSSCKAGLQNLSNDPSQLETLADSLLLLFTKKLKNAGNKPQNLVGWRYTEFAGKLNREEKIEYVKSVSELLYSTSELDGRMDRFHEVLEHLIQQPKPAQRRALASFYLMLSDHNQYCFVKTQEIGRAIQDLTGQKIFKSSNTLSYELTIVFKFFSTVRKALEDSEWQPKDLIDVQSFLWASQSKDSDETDSQVVDESLSEIVSIGETILPLNQILYGPPGTGKTYNTIDEALKILDITFYKEHASNRVKLQEYFQRLTELGQIGFVTFHQSFSYEDFVEGVRAELVDGQVQYYVEDGIFKRMCALEERDIEKESKAAVDLPGKTIWKMSLGNTLGEDSYIYDYCIDSNEIRMGYGRDIDFTECTDRQSVSDKLEESGVELEDQDYRVTAVHTFRTSMAVGDLVVVSDGNTKFRAIAEITGDYQCVSNEDVGHFGQVRKVIWHRVYEKSLGYERIMKKKFSQMTIYNLKDRTVSREKLGELLSSSLAQGAVHPLNEGQILEDTGYQIDSVTSELIRVRVDKTGSLVPFDWMMVNELASYVRSGVVSLSDIVDKKVYEKKPDCHLEKYIVNGYPKMLAKIVEAVTSAKASTTETIEPADPRRVLIIDEINRGNISSIFGELITLVEPSKRKGGAEELTVTLPYSKETFSVPSNLHIIGTMNTADRSLALMDTALRRRFDFIEMMPQAEILRGVIVRGINIESLLNAMNRRIEALYDREHTLGHAFFMLLKEIKDEDEQFAALASIFANKVIPLLEEYFFENWEKIRLVLGDNQVVEANSQFVSAQEGYDTQALFGSVDELEYLDEESRVFARNPAALANPAAYIKIYEAQ